MSETDQPNIETSTAEPVEDISTKACCTTHIDSGTPTGKVEKIGGVDTYVATPDIETDKAIIISTDVFGQVFVNNRLLADKYAKAGFHCFIPDLFNGGPLEPSAVAPMELDRKKMTTYEKFKHNFSITYVALGFAPWILKHNPSSKVPIVESVINDIKSQRGIKSVGLIGYCYGAKTVYQLASQDDKIQAAAVAHPSFTSLPGDIQDIKKPMLFEMAEDDAQLPEGKRKQVEAIMSKKTDVPSTLKFFPGTRHGFAVRGDEDDPVVCKARVEALEVAIEHFKKYL
jgi:dienelactone hydrolase